FQLVIIFMIAELASIPIDSPDVSLIKGAIPIFILLFLQVSISLLSIKSERFKNFVSGTPSVLINEGEINLKEMSSLRISINDLMQQLRLGNSPNITDVQYAVMESNGQLTIIPKPEKRSLTPDDININKEAVFLPLVIVCDGYIYEGNLKEVGYEPKAFLDELEAKGMNDISDVFLAFSDERKVIHIYKRSKNSSEEVFTL
ncbi:MAG: DUF421 domain-containing protein, partial [Eubacteriales bacterium]|nr:DUF421 domain-containing protein [Eubacteriales bacterium]